MPDQIAHMMSPLYQELPAMIELENDIFIGCNPADCTLMCHQLKWLECTSSGRKYHSLMMDPLACFITLFWSSVNTLRILGVSAFGERLFIGQLTVQRLQWLKSNPNPFQNIRMGSTITLYDFFQVSRRRAQIFLTFEANFLVFILV